MNKNALKSFLGNCSCIALLSDIRVTKMISQHTTYKDVGSAENAGAIFCHSIHGNTPKLFQTIFGVHSIHGDKNT